MRYYRKCTNPECPRIKETGKPYQTEAKDHIKCPVCNTDLPPYNPPVAKPATKNTKDTAKPASVDTKEENPMKKNTFNLGEALFWLAVLIIVLFVGYTVFDRVMPTNDVTNPPMITAPVTANTVAYVAPVAATTGTYNAPVTAAIADTSGQVTEQAYIPHPRFYQETGIEGTKTWKNVVVNDDEYLVVGGVVVNGVSDGVYQGYGPGTYAKITVTDGFLSIVDDDWGAQEFDFRVAQAITYKWAHAHINRGPIPE